MEAGLEKRGGKLVVCFDDKAKNKSPLTLENPGMEYLKGLNDKGYGIFETANSFFATKDQLEKFRLETGKPNSTKRHKEFLVSLDEVFADLDICKDSDGTTEQEREDKKKSLMLAISNYCSASVYVITKNGLQPRWWINEKNIDEFTQQKYVNITNGIIEWSKQNGAKGDPVKDVTRILRKPGYYHHKSKPYLVTEEKGNEKIYTLNELSNYFWLEAITKIQDSLPNSDTLALNKVDALDIKQVVVDVWKERGSVAYFDKNDHLVVDGKATATFKGRLGGNYIATTSSDYPAKGNVVTYIAGTLGIDNKEAFKWLCKKYNINNKENKYEKLPDPINAEELCNIEFPPADWLIERIIPQGQITVISGSPSGYKTMTALEWAIKIVSGGKAYNNFNTTQCNVLIVNEDGDIQKNVKKRLLILNEKPSPNLHFLIGAGFKIEEEFIKQLISKIEKHNIGFVIFDSLRGVMPSDKDENDSGAVRQVINRLRLLTNIGVTILIIHHDRKKPANNRYVSSDPNDLGEMMSGSADIRGAVDCHLAMSSKRDKKEDKSYIIVTQTKCREEDLLKPFKVFVNNEKDEKGKTIKLEFLFDGEYDAEDSEETVNMAKEAILDFLFKSAEKEIWRQVIIDSKPGNFRSRTIDKALKILEKVDKSISSKTGKEMSLGGAEARRKFYFIKEKDIVSPEMNLEQMNGGF